MQLASFFCNCCVLLKVLCVSQIVTPFFYTHSNSPLLGRGGVAFFGTYQKFTSWTIFVVFWPFGKPPKFPKWPKQLCTPKIPFSLSISSKTIRAILLFYYTFCKIHLFPHPKTFLGIFWFLFAIFVFVFVSLQHRKTKQDMAFLSKKHSFRSGPGFGCDFCAPSHTICQFTHTKRAQHSLGKNKQNKLDQTITYNLDQWLIYISLNLDQRITLQHLPIYLYIYPVKSKLVQDLAFCRSRTGPSFFLFDSNFSSGRMRFFKEKPNMFQLTIFIGQKLVQLCCATYLDQCWLMLVPIFDF